MKKLAAYAFYVALLGWLGYLMSPLYSQTPATTTPFTGGARTGVSGNGVVKLPLLTNVARTAKSSAGHLTFIQCANTTNSPSYVQFFDVGVSGATQAGPFPVAVGTSSPKAFVGFASATTALYQLDLTMLNGIQVAATTAAQGSAAPATQLDCILGFQ